MPVYVEGNLQSDAYIIVIHGGPGGNGMEYNYGKSAELLEKEFAMCYWDQRGQGNSSGNLNGTLKIQTLADDLNVLAQLIKAKYGNSKKVFILGHSWGGTLGTYALLNTSIQDHINGWIEVDGAHDLPMLNKSAVSMFLKYSQQEIDLGNNVDRWQEILTFINSVDSNNVSNDESGQINSYAFQAEELLGLPRGGQGVDDKGAFNYLFGTTNQVTSGIQGTITNVQLNNEIEAFSPDNLSDIHVPSLILWGKYDFVVPARLGYTAASQINHPDVELVIFEQSGHSPMDNEPELYVQKVVDFVNRN